MDEKLIEEISNTTGVPQMLVSRSAQARAEANIKAQSEANLAGQVVHPQKLPLHLLSKKLW